MRLIITIIIIINHGDISLNVEAINKHIYTLCMCCSTVSIKHPLKYKLIKLAMSGVPLETIKGLLRLTVKRGIGLAVRDVTTSDPYIVVWHGDQKVRTAAVEKSVNPVWDEELTLYATEPIEPLKLKVYDSDMFFDDTMGDAEVDITPFMESVTNNEEPMVDGTVIAKVIPGRENCLIEESEIIWKDRKVTQNMCLRLRNVECGEIELMMQWIEVNAMRRTTTYP
ncbi:GTPase activating protein 1-like [Silene latifolia]|uniref:GTPase activating protein 1-like n=1 Tax=Silene latifolia TaxID=37657 RepID=UPI003D77E457